MNDFVEAVLLQLAVYGALGVLLWGLPATWEQVRAAQYRRESKRLEEDERQRKLAAALDEVAKATAEPGTVPAPVESAPRHRWHPGVLSARLRARNEAILREREERANHG